MATSELDVRSEPPARRHALILTTYEDLGPGEGFVLVNDHDPKPLYYQLAPEHPGRFTWDYHEAGPDVWKVRIGRTGGMSTMSRDTMMRARLSGPTTALARFSPDGVEPQVLHETAEQRVVLLALEDGQAIAPHAPGVSATIVITHGTGDVMTDAGARPVAAGDVTVAPAGRIRGLRARGGRLVAVVTAAPPPTPADHEPVAGEWPAPPAPEPDAGEAIRAEHAGLADRIGELRGLAEGVAELSDEDLRSAVVGAVAFLRRELLPHAHVEDVALYPLLDRLLAATGMATATMSADHQAIAERVAELADIHDRTPADRARIRRLLHELHGLIGVHLAKEEEVYLPLLARLTGDEHRDLLAALQQAHSRLEQAG